MQRRLSLALGGALAVAALVTPVAAAPCDAIPNITTVIYAGGSTALDPVLKAIDTNLFNTGTVVAYADASGQTGSCVGVNFIVNDTKPTGTAHYFDATGAKVSCDLPAGQALDLAFSDVFPTSCPGVASIDPTKVKDVKGPIQPMMFVISKSNPTPQQAITAEEAYFVFGFGGAAGMASPWLKVALQIVRNKGSGTQQMTMRAIGLPGDYINMDKVKGTDAGGSGGVVSMVGTSTDPATIGILSADQYDVHRDTLRALAFKAYHQWFAYYPDSSPTAFDKANVRDGHYWIWGPVHFVYQVSNGTAVHPNAQKFLDYMSGTAPLTPSILDTFITSHVIPQCAMKVDRDSEVGPLKKYADPAPCSCYFEQKAAGATSCTACTDPDGTACSGGGVCRHKFCEAN